MKGAAPARPRAPRVPQRERRRQLLDAALSVLAEEGFGALSMEAVARRAGVDRVVVYRSFPSLHLLLLALLRREQRRTERQLDALIPEDPGERDARELLHAGVVGFLDAVAAEPRTWRLALLPPEGAPVTLRAAVDRRRAAAERRLRRLVEWGSGRLAVPPGAIDAEVLSRMILSVCEEHGRLLLEGVFTRERLAESAQRLLDAVAWR